MSTDFHDIAEQLRMRQVVDQSTVTVPPYGGVGDLPTIFNQMFDKENSKSTTNISSREAGLCALLSAMSKVTYKSSLNDFVTVFLNDFLTLKGSVEGFMSKQMANICSGNVQYERKLEFARIKGKEKEDFV
ncbi:MAG: hypothetical protein H7836_17275 [Magnetococcus sp. YQC-3]